MRKSIIILFLCFFSLNLMEGKNEKYYFKHLGMKEGLSQSSVLCILQDQKGFMWFGTKDGLNRYDGDSFRVFKPETGNPTSLGNNVINSIYESSEGVIWVGTDAGIYLYYPEKEAFERFDIASNLQTQIEQPVYQISADKNENIWIAVESQGIFYYSLTEHSLTHYLIPEANKIGSFCIDNQNSIWVGYKGKGLFYTNDNFQTFLLFEPKNRPDIFADDQIFTLIAEHHNQIYICSSKGGLKRLNIITQELTDLLPSSGSNEAIFARNLLKNSDNELWIATENGIYIYNTITNESHHITHNSNDPYSISDNAIYSIYKDEEESIWIGSYFGGIDYYPKPYTSFEKYYPITDKNSLSGRIVREFCEDAQGNLWIGTEDGGLNQFNPVTQRFTQYKNPDLYHNIHALCRDNNTLWVGTYSKGLHRLNLTTNQFEYYTMGSAENTLNDNSIYSICKTSTGELYIGTPTGLNKYNYSTNDFTSISLLNGFFVFNILEDHNGIIWFATYNAGIFKYNPRDESWKNYNSNSDICSKLPYNKVISICEDSKGNIWFSLQGNGICSFNPEREDFICYNSEDGLPNDVIYKIIEEKEGIFWLTSNNGLIRFDVANKQFKTYTTDNGLLNNQFNYCSGIKSKNGKIYFGGIDGFICFNPETFIDNKNFPPLEITDFLLFNKKTTIGKDSPLNKSITFSEKLELNYKQNSFALHFSALSYVAPQTNRLAYQLVGFDKEWYPASSNMIATYTNLRPGNYTFCLRSANDSGIWNDKYKTVQIRIHPPLWQTPLAYIFYFLLATGLITYFIHRFQKRILSKQKRQFEKLEIEKEKEIYHAKIDFFTNIAHEIRTPLTLIKGPLEYILKKHTLSEEEVKENLQVMEQNTNRLLNLTNQLLDFRKTETKGFTLNFMEYNISLLLRETYKRFSQSAKQNNLEFTLILPEEDFYAPVDKEALTKIVSNLFNNAMKYSTSYIRVTLDAEIENKPNFFSIIVCNDGNPISSDMREEIFKPFVQITNHTNGKRGAGTGIGLSLARSLAELHKGNLYIKECEEICFCLELPVIQHKVIHFPEKQTEKQEKRREYPIAKTSEEKKTTILIVEDDPEMQVFITKQLNELYNIVTAANGREAIKSLENTTIHLIVSDVMMPEMDGFELCKLLKSDISYSHIPIILLTARATLQSKIEGIELGADAYIEKPFSTEYLLVRIANLLTNQEKLRKAFASSPFVEAKSIALSKADEQFLEKLSATIHKNISDSDFNVDVLAEEMNMSRSSLHRKIKGIAQMTPNDYIQLERLKMAAQLIQSGEYRINEVCYIVGFNSSSYFARCFHKQFGVLPKDFYKCHTSM